MYLEKINAPEDVKKLNQDEMNALAAEMRQALMFRLSKHGGHFGPNFGMVEATIALHYVFDSPKDKIVFDVSHQSYPHKMLTGRKDAYLYEEHFDDIPAIPIRMRASTISLPGHTSTSVSLASGLAKDVI
ncbi:MAG: 1-deoxy-D-xylulose-5-phosphate synthase N-terminal domain-containing protein [Ruminococcus sp.]